MVRNLKNVCGLRANPLEGDFEEEFLKPQPMFVFCFFLIPSRLGRHAEACLRCYIGSFASLDCKVRKRFVSCFVFGAYIFSARAKASARNVNISVNKGNGEMRTSLDAELAWLQSQEGE